MSKKDWAKIILKNLLIAFLLSTCLTSVFIPLFNNRLLYGAVGGRFNLDMFLVDGLFNLGLTLNSTTIFFNLFPVVRQNNFLRALSFFLLPLISVIQLFFMFKAYFCFSEAVVSFFIVQTIFYIRFNQTIKKKSE
ncbi:MAG: hypothetical protein ACHQII_08210 [Bacteroidia bacterium]